MRRRIVLGLAAAVSIDCAAAQQPSASCEATGPPQFLPTVPEASGVAVADGTLWTHNDSGAPLLFRFDASGRTAPVTVVGAEVRDWEDLAVSTCLDSTAECVYIADIGDNREARDRITIYKVRVPNARSASTAPAVSIHVRYPDHPHDAEALVVTKTTGAFVITKEVPPLVYRFAASQGRGTTGTLTLFRTLDEKIRVTGAAVSSDDRWIALRSNSTLLVYAVDEFAKGGEPVRVDLRGLKEPQGEGVAFGRDGDLYLVSEGGGQDAPGVLTRVHCAFIR